MIRRLPREQPDPEPGVSVIQPRQPRKRRRKGQAFRIHYFRRLAEIKADEREHLKAPWRGSMEGGW